LVVAVRRRLKEPEAWQKAAHAGHAGPAVEERLGKLSDLLTEPRWRRHTIIGVLLALAGVVGLWGVGFWTFELIPEVLRPQHVPESDINTIRSEEHTSELQSR